MLSTPVKDGKAVLEELTGQRKEEAEDDDMDWDEEVLGEMEGGYENKVSHWMMFWNSGATASAGSFKTDRGNQFM